MTRLQAKLLSICECIRQQITPQRLAVFCGLIYFVSLVPLLWLSGYNHPLGDDLTYGAAAHLAWRSEHSVWAAIRAAMQTTVYTWQNWQGTYTAVFLFSLHPAIFGRQFYALTSWIILGTLTFSIIYLFRVLMVNLLHIDKHLSHISAFVTLFMMIHFMDYAPRIEGYFWYNSGIHYMLIHSVSFIYLAKTASFFKDEGFKGKKRVLAIMLATVLAIFVGGGAYMSILPTMVMATTLLVLAAWKKKWSVLVNMLIPFGFFVLGFLVNVLAPGNMIRQGGVGERLGPLEAIAESFYHVFRGTFYLRSMTSLILLLLIFLVPVFNKAARQTSFRFRYPLVVVLFAVCLLASTATPPLYVGIEFHQGRFYSLLFVEFILLSVLCVFYVVGWMAKHLERPAESVTGQKRFSSASLITMLASASVVFLVMGLYVMEESHQFTFSSAMTDILNGRAKAFHTAQLERDIILMAADPDDEVVVLELPGIPTLFNDQLSPDGESYYYNKLAEYYNVKSVWILVE